jgi:hypothetical protein
MDIYLGADREGCRTAPVLICFHFVWGILDAFDFDYQGVEIRSLGLR